MTAVQLIQTSNALHETIVLNEDNSKFKMHAVRLYVKLQHEGEFWNSLTPQERELLADEEVPLGEEFTLPHPPSLFRPEHYEDLKRVIPNLQRPALKLRELLDKKTPQEAPAQGKG